MLLSETLSLQYGLTKSPITCKNKNKNCRWKIKKSMTDEKNLFLDLGLQQQDFRKQMSKSQHRGVVSGT